MSGRIKGLLIVLALGALVSVWYLRSAVSNAAQGALGADISQPIVQQGTGNADDDHDGLTNAQEAYWRTDPNNPDTDGDGFKDGEEVLTGHNPLVKGPNDFLNPNQNLTQRTVDLTLGGMLAGDLNPASAGYQQSVKLLADAMVQQYKQNTTVVVDSLDIIDDTDANTRQYVLAMSAALTKILAPAFQDNQDFLDSISDVPVADPSALTGDATRYAKFVQTAQRLAATSGTRAAQVAAIPVPQFFVSQQTSAVRILRTLQKYYELVATLKQDPLQGSLVINALIQVQSDVMPQFIYDYRTALYKKFSQ